MKVTNNINYKNTTIGLSVLLILSAMFILLLSKQSAHTKYEKKYGGSEMHEKHDRKKDSMTDMDHSMQMMNNTLIGKTGVELEQAFLKEMVVHHQGALDMANTLKAGTQRPELIQFANDIITTQTKEIEMMKAWQTVTN